MQSSRWCSETSLDLGLTSQLNEPRGPRQSRQSGREKDMELSEAEDRISGESSIGNCRDLCAPGPREVLAELVELLEEYGPSWYTEEQHNRAITALQR